jgi:hypothetical protein
MSLLTIFSAPKPFSDPRIATIQMNAVASWMRLPDAEVLLMGDEEGVAKACQDAGATHVPRVGRNDRGTPLISSMMNLAREHSTSELLCIINADMLLLSDFVTSARGVSQLKPRFVLLGQRWDLDVTTPIQFQEGWEDQLRNRLHTAGKLHRPAGSDYFVFPRDCYAELPDFAVGRAGWDNWMIFEAHRRRWPVVDGTASTVVVHQNHDYGHLPDGAPHYSAPETKVNIRLAGGDAAVRYTILDADYRLEGGRLVRPALSSARALRRLELVLRSIFFFLPAGAVEEIVRPRRWRKRFLRVLGRR